jgi:hypothetical protein
MQTFAQVSPQDRALMGLVAAHPTGAVSGSVRTLLRLEGLALCATAVAAYAHAGGSWTWFVLLFLIPDLSFIGYLAGPRGGAVIYNLAHSYVLALALAGAGYAVGAPLASAVGLIWIAHIGFDRGLGYGLKYPTSFNDTHLGRTGRPTASTSGTPPPSTE